MAAFDRGNLSSIDSLASPHQRGWGWLGYGWALMGVVNVGVVSNSSDRAPKHTPRAPLFVQYLAMGLHTHIQ